MRGMFGLISLLLGIALMAYLWANHTAAVSQGNKQVMDEARQISGRDSEGKPALDSIKTDAARDAGGRMKYLLVTDIEAGGAMEKLYGLKKGDKISMLGSYPVDLSNDPGTATAMLLEAYKGSQPLTVLRDGKEITLPLTSSGPAPSSPVNSIEDQVRQIQKQVGQ